MSPAKRAVRIQALIAQHSVLVEKRTDGGRLDHVADGESLDCLVLGRASRAVGAADGLDVAATVLVATAAESCQHFSLASSRACRSYLADLFLTMLDVLRVCVASKKSSRSLGVVERFFAPSHVVVVLSEDAKKFCAIT